MGVKVRLSYPDAMRRDVERKGMEWFARGGEFESFSDAVEKARGLAEVKNFPIQVTYMGQKMTVYPEAIGY